MGYTATQAASLARGVCFRCDANPISPRSKSRCEDCLKDERDKALLRYQGRPKMIVRENRCGICGNPDHNQRTCTMSKCAVCGLTEKTPAPEERYKHISKFTQCLDGFTRCDACYKRYKETPK